MVRRLTVTAAALLGMSAASHAAVLDAGQGQTYALPSQAIAAAHDGDTIRIHPGQYFDCAIVRRNNVTIEGVGSGAVLTDKPCAGKGLLVINGDNVTVRNLTLQRVRVPDENGAGIRAQGGNLTVENTRFLDDQNGILGPFNPHAVLRISHSTFVKDGFCGRNCAHGVYVGEAAELDVVQSRFFDIQQGHAIKSRALVTKVIGCDIQDGPNGTSSYQIDVPWGGSVLIENNLLEKGPNAQNHAYAITIGEEGVRQPSDDIVIRNNTLVNNTGHPTTFVRNVTATPAQLSGNVFKGGPVHPLQGDGSSS